MVSGCIDLEQIYDDTIDDLYGFLLSLKMPEEQVRDIIQQLFAKLAAKPARLKGVRNVKSYLLKSAYRLFLDERRRHAREVDDPGMREEEMGLFAAGTDPDAEQMRRQVEDALFGLPEPQRVVVVLKLWQQASFAEIAHITGESMGTVTSRYRYGINKMQSQLRPFYEELK